MTEELKGDQPENPQGDGLKQVGGKWYLAFTWYNEYEKGDQREEVKLKATNEEEAIAEAESMKQSGEKVRGSTGTIDIPGNFEVIYKAVRGNVTRTLDRADR